MDSSVGARSPHAPDVQGLLGRRCDEQSPVLCPPPPKARLGGSHSCILRPEAVSDMTSASKRGIPGPHGRRAVLQMPCCRMKSGLSGRVNRAVHQADADHMARWRHAATFRKAFPSMWLVRRARNGLVGSLQKLPASGSFAHIQASGYYGPAAKRSGPCLRVAVIKGAAGV